jgi:hypothetical protein
MMSPCPPDIDRDEISLESIKENKVGSLNSIVVPKVSREGIVPNTMMKSRFLETTSSTKRGSVKLLMIE